MIKMNQSIQSQVCEQTGWPESASSLKNLFMKFSESFQNYLQLGPKRVVRDDHKFDTPKCLALGKKESPKAWEIELERQLQAWRENSYWVDQPPEIKVSVPKGSLCNLKAKVKTGLPPDAVFNIITDPDNKRVFKNIQKVISRRVLVDEGFRQVVEVEQAANWRFLWWSGTISVHVTVVQDRREHEVKFKQGKSGFMERFEGCWKIEPLYVDEGLCSGYKPKTLSEYDTCSGGKGRLGSIINLEQLVQPAVVPPPPISWYLRGITTRTTETLINDLLAEARRLRVSNYADSGIDSCMENEEGFSLNNSVDIKERWRSRRFKHRKNSFIA